MDKSGRMAIATGKAGGASRFTAPGCARLVNGFILVVLLAGLGAWSGKTYAAACISVQTGDWSKKSTWGTNKDGCVGTPNGIPGPADSVTIAAGHIVTMTDNPGEALSLTIDGTAEWGNPARTTNIGAGGIVINAGGDITGTTLGVLTSAGGLTLNANLTSTTVTIVLQTAAQNISGTGSLANLTVTGITATNTGTLTVGTALAGTGTLANTGTLNLAGTSAITTLTAGGTGNTVNYMGAAQTVNLPTGSTYANLLLSGSGIKTMPAAPLTVTNLSLSGTASATASDAITVGGNLTIAAGTTFSAGAFNHSVSGNLDATGTFNAGTGTLTLNGAAVQTISGTNPVTFNNLDVTNVSVPNVTLATNVTVATLNGTVTLTNTCPTDWLLTSTTPAQVLHSCALDHLEIRHASGTGLTCAASTLIVVACQDVACTAFYTGGISGTLSAAGVPTVNWDGGTGFAIPSGSSSVTKNVQVVSAGTVVFGVSSATPSPPSAATCNFGAPACTFTASLAGFIFSDTATGGTYTILPQVSGIDSSMLYLRAVQATTTNPAVCTPAIISSTTNVTMGYTCTDPASCQAGNLATITNATTSTATAIAPGGTAVSLNFDANGSAPVTVRYDDAGKITVDASVTVTPFGGATATTLTGSSNAYVVAPHHFGISGVTAAPIKAGNDFAATVTAYNGLATPTVTANFGQEMAAEDVTLSFTKCQPTLGSAVNGAFTGSVGPFAGGAASAVNLNWSEVGNGDLVATLTGGNYLGSGLTATGNTGTGGTACNGAGGAGNVGRFIPDHFITTITDGCTGSGFSYSGQPFTISVTAMNGLAIPTTTVNYDGTANTSPNFSKEVTLTAWDALTGLIPDPDGALTNSSILAADFTQGVATINAINVGPATLAPVYTFTSRTTVPASIRIRSNDPDAVNSSGFSEGTSEIRSGRANLANAHGLELHALPVPFRTEYWSGGWVLNAADGCSGDGLSGGTVGVTFSAAPVTCAQDTGSPGLSGSGCAAAGPVSQRFKEGGVAGFAGDFNLWLKAPGSGNTGTVTVTGNVPAWLQYPWTGAAAVNPSARATFGIYRGPQEFIDLRENY